METESKELKPDTVLCGVRMALQNPNLGRYFVAEVGNPSRGEPPRIIGQCMLTTEWSDWRSGQFWWLQSVYVEPEWRGRGVFRALYRHVESLARVTPGVCGLRLYVERHNESAQAIYTQLGMAPSGHVVFELDWS